MKNDSKSEAEVLQWALELQQGLHRERNSRLLFHRFYSGYCSFFKRRGFPHEAEDLAQETLYQALANIESFQGRTYVSLRAWLNTIAKYCAGNRRRFMRQLRRQGEEVSLDASATPLDFESRTTSGEPGPDRATFARQRLDAALRLVKEMPEKQRLCALAHFVQGLDHEEIATLFKIATGTVRAHIFHARQQLRTQLGEDFEVWRE